MEKIPITIENEKKLQEELQKLKSVERPRIVQAIAAAREHGDLKENAEYHAAREEQGLLEAKISKIENTLSRAEIIDITKIPHSDKVVFGSTVIVNDITESKNKRMTYKIVGEYEANAEKGLIFFKSPLARALMGKEKGDFIEVHFPAGVKSFEIVDVKYI
jgi:transcription elongation factor GreA|tara:strand:- start:195 stop:677 length:483 start_codon:yes stop_codon:yes gene_type:complete